MSQTHHARTAKKITSLAVIAPPRPQAGVDAYDSAVVDLPPEAAKQNKLAQATARGAAGGGDGMLFLTKTTANRGTNMCRA
eukprot:1335310-Pyramimonas_sp.AAC.1